MASLSEIESYKGDAALGAGSPVVAKTDFDAINRAGEQWALQKVAAAKNIFDQKIRDRDILYQMFSDGQVSTGNIDVDDRKKVVEPALKDLNDAYEKYATSGINDKEAYMDYLKAHTKYKDIVAHAQSRYASQNKYDEAIGNAKTETERKAIIEFKNKEKEKPFDQFLDPYVRAIDHDPNAVINDEGGWVGTTVGDKSISSEEQKPLQSNTYNTNLANGGTPMMMPSQQRVSTTVKTGAKGVPTKSTTITNLPPKEMKGKEFVSDPKNDIYYDKERGLAFVKQPTTTYNFDAIKQKFGKEWVEMKEGTDNINESVKAFENAGGDTQKEIIDGIKNAIVKYNEEVGEGGKKIDIDPEKIAAPTGQKDQFGNQKYKLSGSVSPYEYAALLNLASQKSFKRGGWVEDKDLTASMQAAQKEKDLVAHQKDMSNIGWERVHNQAKLNQAKMNALSGEDVNPYLEKQWNGNFKAQGSLSTSMPNTSTIPMVTFGNNGKIDLFKPIGGKPVYQIGEYNSTDKTYDRSKPSLIKPDKIVEYEGGSYDHVFMKDGKSVSFGDLTSGYPKYVSELKKAGLKDSDIGDMSEYITSLIENKKSGWQVALKGADHTLTKDEWMAAQRALSNKLTKSKQQGIFQGIMSDTEETQDNSDDQ